MAPSREQSPCFSEHINCIRSILVKTLSSENISKSDVLKVKRFEGYAKVQTSASVDKELRLRSVKERQNEERQKKLEEIKAQALAAQKFKEQKEQERRKRLEEMRVKDDIRRQQVEERKRAINEAERDRLESILRRNHEREARIEAKKRNERSNIVFAFGSSTPRMLDPTDASVSFWGHRRATSTQNITSASTMSTSLTRRQSERDLDTGSKKRATSAGGLERSGESMISPSTPAGCASGYVGRRRTDLVPTVPSRDSSFASSGSRKSLNHSPGRAYSMSRLDQLAKPRKRADTASGLPALNECTLSPGRSVTRSMSHLAHVGKAPTATRRPLHKTDSRSMHHLSADGVPIAPPRANRATQLRQQKLLMAQQQSSSCSEASSRPSSSLSQQSTNSVSNSVNIRHRLSATPRRPRPASIAVTGVTTDIRENKPPLPRTRKSITKTTVERKPIDKNKIKSPTDESVGKEIPHEIIKTADNEKIESANKVPPIVENAILDANESTASNNIIPQGQTELEIEVPKTEEAKTVVEIPAEKIPTPQISSETSVNTSTNKIQEFINIERSEMAIVQTESTNPDVSNTETKESDSNEMTTSINKPRITTEEEAKAALAERRRLAREEAERQAELERQRVEAEQKAELERQLREEEEARQLVQLQRQAEQERLQEAIREAQKREEEEKQRREEEQRLKQLKEEADKKAREEAEKQKLELQEKFKNEEKEREERRKRVEMIMSRTRGKNNTNNASQQNSQDKNENKSEKQVDENKLNEENKINGTKQENGTAENTKEAKDIGIVDNIIPDESVKNANTVRDTINSDSINSNSAWQPTQQYGNLVCNNNS
ncbi:MAP7 domain-containing protein 1-like isoform X2 [Cylas formicarius]|uniref:MAP7 domain-containing protein 1-like isoform X2 n=1 Tax=Cylas formicarius TaxID=197179 RepID=UPI0029587D0B|nr:MAP7 domain-containing protein 1-like isoform X2 [Cylas formicarius]